MQEIRNRRIDLGLAVAVLVGGSLRLWGIGFGLPIKSNLYIRPDESLLVEPALHLLERWGDPLFYVYPALVVEVTAVLYHVYFALASLAGCSAGLSLPDAFAAAPSPYFLLPRLLSAAVGTATIYLVYRMAVGLSGDRVAGVAAASLYAVAPLAVRDAHFGVTDNVMVLFLTGSLLAGMGYVSGTGAKAGRSLRSAAILFGLASASKYTAVLLGPRLAAAALFDAKSPSWPLRFRRIALLVLVSSAVFFLLNPYVISNWRETLDELLNILRIFYLWQPGDPPWTLQESLKQILRPLRYGPGGPIGLVLAAAGVIGGLQRDSKRRAGVFLLAGYLVLHLAALIPFRHLVPYRYLLPVLPLIAVFATVWTVGLARVSPRALARIAATALLMTAFAVSAYQSVRISLLLARDDTRSQAGAWIESNLPHSMPVVVLCPPEAEPQVFESRASLLRRIDYVGLRYGPKSGDFISRLYRDQLRNPVRKDEGWELHRFPEPSAVAEAEVAVVSCDHPLRMGRTDRETLELWSGTVMNEARFQSCSEADTAAWDWIDAVFLPFSDFEKIERPGPNISVVIVDRRETR